MNGNGQLTLEIVKAIQDSSYKYYIPANIGDANLSEKYYALRFLACKLLNDELNDLNYMKVLEAYNIIVNYMYIGNGCEASIKNNQKRKLIDNKQDIFYSSYDFIIFIMTNRLDIAIKYLGKCPLFNLISSFNEFPGDEADGLQKFSGLIFRNHILKKLQKEVFESSDIKLNEMPPPDSQKAFSKCLFCLIMVAMKAGERKSIIRDNSKYFGDYRIPFINLVIEKETREDCPCLTFKDVHAIHSCPISPTCACLHTFLKLVNLPRYVLPTSILRMVISRKKIKVKICCIYIASLLKDRRNIILELLSHLVSTTPIFNTPLRSIPTGFMNYKALYNTPIDIIFRDIIENVKYDEYLIKNIRQNGIPINMPLINGRNLMYFDLIKTLYSPYVGVKCITCASGVDEFYHERTSNFIEYLILNNAGKTALQDQQNHCPLADSLLRGSTTKTIYLISHGVYHQRGLSNKYWNDIHSKYWQTYGQNILFYNFYKIKLKHVDLALIRDDYIALACLLNAGFECSRDKLQKCLSRLRNITIFFPNDDTFQAKIQSGDHAFYLDIRVFKFIESLISDKINMKNIVKPLKSFSIDKIRLILREKYGGITKHNLKGLEGKLPKLMLEELLFHDFSKYIFNEKFNYIITCQKTAGQSNAFW